MDAFVHRHNFSGWSQKFQSELSTGTLDGHKVMVLKPQTYMNLSGQSVAAAAGFYKMAPEQIIVFHDELDLIPGKLRVKKGGGSGGHNGIKSIDQHIGTEYWRVRMGIGHPGHPDLVSNYVLNDFAKGDQEWLAPFVEICARDSGLLLAGDMEGYMTKIAKDCPPPKPKEQKQNEG